jgi:cystathionine beta-lyase/cystathionine gamma-synthase
LATDQINIIIPILVGLGAVAFAILERGYKRFLDEKKIAEAEGRTLKFDLAYLINMIVTAGVTSGFVAIIPVLVETVGQPNEVTFVSLLLTAATGYTTAYTILDKMNTKTDVKIEVAKMITDNKDLKKELKESQNNNKNPT